TYPILGAYWLGVDYLNDYQDPTNIAKMAARDVVVISGWPELEGVRGVSNNTIVNAVHAINPNCVIVCYTDVERVYKDSFTSAHATRRAKIAAENWYVYSSGTTGTPLDSYYSNDGYAINVSTYSPQDSSGRLPCEWMADYEWSWMAEGADNNTACPGWNGIFFDNALVQPRFNADWTRSGGSDNASTVAAEYRAGIAAGAIRFKENNPTKYVFGNIAELPNLGTSA